MVRIDAGAGQAERRAIENFRTGAYPQWKKRIDAAAGYELPVDVAWDTLGALGHAGSLHEYLPKVFFQPLIDALASVAGDDAGREALRVGLHRVVVTNSGHHSGPDGLSFVDCVLTMDQRPEVGVDLVEERTKNLRLLLEDSL
jgi:hypothetical protein